MNNIKISNAADLENAYDNFGNSVPDGYALDMVCHFVDGKAEIGDGYAILSKEIEGAHGVSCWGGRRSYWDESPMESYEFYNYLVHPFLSYLLENNAFKQEVDWDVLDKIEFPQYEYQDSSDSDYYGNYTKKQVFEISFRNMFDVLTQANVLA